VQTGSAATRNKTSQTAQKGGIKTKLENTSMHFGQPKPPFPPGSAHFPPVDEDCPPIALWLLLFFAKEKEKVCGCCCSGDDKTLGGGACRVVVVVPIDMALVVLAKT
jgi:hypothetical protein